MMTQAMRRTLTRRPITKNHRFRSGLEREAARQLELAGCDYGYECEKIEYLKPAKTSKYCPDFVLTKKDGTKLYLETKGRFLTEDRQKWLLIRDQRPDLDIRLIFQNAHAKISKTSSTTYAKWASDKGFKWADKGKIPKEWLEE